MQNKFQISNLKSQINTNILEQILKKTKEEVEKRKNAYSSREPAKPENREVRTTGVLDFARTIKNAAEKKGVAFIAEIKLASPSESSLGFENDLVERAKQYEEAGVDAISVVTEKHFFKGDPLFVTKIKETVSVPILQKDFVIDEYQIYEAKKIGADAILLIARLLEKEQLIDFVDLAFSLNIDPVVEVHTQEDLEKAVAASNAVGTMPTGIIAVNARDLDTMEVHIDKACELLKKIPEGFIKLGFSGISSKTDVEKYRAVEVDGVLVGTSIMKAHNIKEFIKSL